MTKRRPHLGFPPPPTPVVGLRHLAYRAWSAVLRWWTRWRCAWLAVMLACLAAGTAWGGAWREAAAAWVVAGAAAWTVGRLAEADATRRVLEHERCGLPSVGGWRLAAGARDLPARELLLLALVLRLHAEARLVRRQVAGHRHGAWRITYEVPLREEARRWAKASGHISVRTADGMMRELEARGVVARVTVNQATAYRLAFGSAEDALRHLERASGRPLVAWRLGRDPRADGWRAGGPAGADGGR